MAGFINPESWNIPLKALAGNVGALNRWLLFNYLPKMQEQQPQYRAFLPDIAPGRTRGSF